MTWFAPPACDLNRSISSTVNQFFPFFPTSCSVMCGRDFFFFCLFRLLMIIISRPVANVFHAKFVYSLFVACVLLFYVLWCALWCALEKSSLSSSSLSSLFLDSSSSSFFGSASFLLFFLFCFTQRTRSTSICAGAFGSGSSSSLSSRRVGYLKSLTSGVRSSGGGCSSVGL